MIVRVLREINALCYLLRYEYNRTKFLYVSEGEEGCFYFLKMLKRKKTVAQVQFLSVPPFFFKKKRKENLKESQDLSVNKFLLML